MFPRTLDRQCVTDRASLAEMGSDEESERRHWSRGTYSLMAHGQRLFGAVDLVIYLEAVQ
jgi:hypothetical protein